MKALAYLYLTRLKNRLKSIVKSPGAIIFIVFIIAILVVSVFTSMQNGETTEYRDIAEVYALILVLYCTVFIMTSYNGLSKGASLYSMPDVNLVFVAPISSKKVLLYGLIQQMGTSLVIGFFLLFQYGWLHSTYGISMIFLILILLGYAMTIFCGQLTAMALYSFTTGREKRKGIAKAALLAVCGFPILFTLLSVYPEKGHLISATVSVANNLPITLFPVGGWAQATIVGFITNEWGRALIGLGSLLAYVIILVLIMAKAKTDFYEDVLQATEISYSAITASKQGRIDAAIPHNVKLGRTGLGKGFGADSFYYKHRLESRRSRAFILDRTTLIFIAITFIVAIFMKNIGIIAVFSFATYMQVFSVALGRWIRELLLPYVYLVPESAFSKLMHCLRESLLRIVVEAIILFVPISFLLEMNPVETATCILARISFALLFTAGNIMVERFFSGIVIKVLAVMIYFFIMILLIVPGVALVIVLTVAEVNILPATIQIFAALTICNLLVSMIVIFLCRNMLEFAELNHR